MEPTLCTLIILPRENFGWIKSINTRNVCNVQGRGGGGMGSQGLPMEFLDEKIMKKSRNLNETFHAR
jgi:hypothetical protein